MGDSAELGVLFVMVLLTLIFLGGPFLVGEMAEVFARGVKAQQNPSPGPRPSVAYARWYRTAYVKERARGEVKESSLYDREIDGSRGPL